jgi:hypothetical protein
MVYSGPVPPGTGVNYDTDRTPRYAAAGTRHRRPR